MAKYIYQAKKGPKEIIEGKVEAQTEKEAIEQVSQMGYTPVRITLEEVSVEQSPKVVSMPASGKIRSREITIFSRQLASLLKSGVPILKAFRIISEQSGNLGLKNVLNQIYRAVKEGETFSSALLKHRKVFSTLYVAMVRAGEDSGALPEVLLKIADYRSKQEEMLARFRMALAYPILMAVVGIATVLFMLIFVMPRLTQIFVNMEQTLPLPTQLLIAISAGMKQWGLWILGALVLVSLIIKRQLNTAAGRLSLSIFKLRLPILGKFILKAELSRFSRTLELLIKNSIPILRAINIAIPVLSNEVIKNHLKQSSVDLEQGGSFGESLKNARIFPLFMSNLIIVGEESGNLGDALSEVAGSYEQDTDDTIKIMGSLLEPMMILGVGLVVGFIVVAMLLPIFEINIMVG